MSHPFELRTPGPQELKNVAHMLDRAFGNHNFLRDFPHLWIPEEAPSYRLCLHDGQMVGGVGIYPRTIRLAGVDFRGAGIGQVGTVPEYRGQGVMSRLLEQVTAELDGGSYDFAWLHGDRQRYGHYGWATGGYTLRARVSARYLPPPPAASEVTPMDPLQDAPGVEAALAASPYAVRLDRCEIQDRLASPKYAGWRYGSAWIVMASHGGRLKVVLAHGPEDEIALILAHLVRPSESADNLATARTTVTIDSPPGDSLLMRTARRYGESFTTEHAKSFRICNLTGFLTKASQIVAGRVATGAGELSLKNSQTGQQAKISCRDGEIRIDDQAGPDAVSLTTAELSEVLFGPWPLEVTLPSLPLNSPLRPLLRSPIHVGDFSYV